MLQDFNIDCRWRNVVNFSPRSFISGERTKDTQLIGSSVDPIAGVDISGKGNRKKTCLTTCRVASINSKFYLNPIIFLKIISDIKA